MYFLLAGVTMNRNASLILSIIFDISILKIERLCNNRFGKLGKTDDHIEISEAECG